MRPARPTPRSRHRCCSGCRGGGCSWSRSSSRGSRSRGCSSPRTNLKPGGGARDTRDRARPARRAPLLRGEPARGRMHALPRARAEGRRDLRPGKVRVPAEPDDDLRGDLRHPRTRSPRSTTITTGDLRGAGRDAVVEHPVRGRAHRPADQRHRAIPGRHELGERPVRGEHVHRTPRPRARVPRSSARGHGTGRSSRATASASPEAPVMPAASCLGFDIECDVLFKGAGVRDRRRHPVRRQRLRPARRRVRPLDGLPACCPSRSRAG